MRQQYIGAEHQLVIDAQRQLEFGRRPQASSWAAWSPTPAASTTVRSTPRPGRACRRRRPPTQQVTVTYLQSTTQSDYTPNINTFIGKKCGIIVTVGFLMAGATQTAAKANPSAEFAIVDNAYTPAA